MSKSREQLIDYLRQVDITDKVVLDVGVQDNPARRYTFGKAREYVTLDIDKKWEPNLVKDLNSKIFDDFDDDDFQRFDVIFCLEVLEHIWNPLQAVENLSFYTKPGGVCYISVPFINPIHDEWDYLRYTDEWFLKVLKKYGFKNINVQYRKATLGSFDLSEFYKKEGLRMSKIRQNNGEGYKMDLIGLFIEARK